jgi:hypothetical protein
MRDDPQQVVRANLNLRRELAVEVAKAVEPVPLGHKILNMKRGAFDWWRNYLGRSEDQPLIFALLFVLIAITLYVFL